MTKSTEGEGKFRHKLVNFQKPSVAAVHPVNPPFSINGSIMIVNVLVSTPQIAYHITLQKLKKEQTRDYSNTQNHNLIDSKRAINKVSKLQIRPHIPSNKTIQTEQNLWVLPQSMQNQQKT